MKEIDLFKDLTDSEYKIYNFILKYRESHAWDSVPSVPHIMHNLDKARATVFRALAGLRAAGLI